MRQRGLPRRWKRLRPKKSQWWKEQQKIMKKHEKQRTLTFRRMSKLVISKFFKN